MRSIILSEEVFPFFLGIIFVFWGVEAMVRACMARNRYWWLSLINGIILSIVGFLFFEGGYINDMFMVSFLTSIAFIYWGMTIAIAAYDLKPGVSVEIED